MLREVVAEQRGRRVILVDSMSQAEYEDHDQILVAASNGGAESGRVAVRCGCACAVFNDAGGGKDGAGIAGLAIMDQAGIAGAAVGHFTARISDARDMWENGVLTHVNEAGRAAGLRVGDPVQAAIARFFEEAAA
ncbi:hypothetical protein [Amycolatopsis jejuensis]|uniref:hypothetical protein n=1 Tax=Amycolatopsis jejuensis TaxID=330084 RepID=UPI000524BC67|nr:hypothetical protein [Amycolatopsis jejuensis]